MSDQGRFEVYPPAAEAGPAPGPTVPAPAQTWEQPDPAGPAPDYPVTAYRPPQVSPSPAGQGPSRRTVIGLAIGLPVVGFILSVGLRAEESALPGGYEDGGYQDGGYDPGEETVDVSSIAIGPWVLDVPDGWADSWEAADEVVLTHGANRLQAYSFTAYGSDQALDLVEPMVKRRLGAFRGTLGGPVDDSDAEVQRATVRTAGTVRGKNALLTGHLWISAAGDALLLVEVLTAKASGRVAGELRAMVDQLEGEFG